MDGIETIDEYVNNTMSKHSDCQTCKVGKLICEDDHIRCEVSECDGHYIGLYWKPYEYDEDIEQLVMQCCKCRDEIEI